MSKKLSREQINDLNNIAGAGDSWMEPVIYIIIGALVLLFMHIFL